MISANWIRLITPLFTYKKNVAPKEKVQFAANVRIENVCWFIKPYNRIWVRRMGIVCQKEQAVRETRKWLGDFIMAIRTVKLKMYWLRWAVIGLCSKLVAEFQRRGLSGLHVDLKRKSKNGVNFYSRSNFFFVFFWLGNAFLDHRWFRAMSGSI